MKKIAELIVWETARRAWVFMACGEVDTQTIAGETWLALKEKMNKHLETSREQFAKTFYDALIGKTLRQWYMFMISKKWIRDFNKKFNEAKVVRTFT